MTKQFNYLNIIFKNLKFLAILPPDSQYAILNYLYPFYFGFHMLCWVHLNFGIAINVVLNSNEMDLIDLCRSIALVFALTSEFVKFYPLVSRRSVIYKLKDEMNDYLVENLQLNYNQNAIQWRINLINRLTIAYLIGINVNIVTYSSAPLLTKLLSESSTGNNTIIVENEVPLPVWYPFNYKLPIYYELIYLSQFLGTIMTASTLSGANLFYFALINFHTCQYECLANNMRNLVDEEMSTSTFIKTVLHHRKILRFAEKFRKFVEPIMAFECFMVTVQCSFIILALATVPFGPALLAQMVFLLIEFAQLYVFGWFCSDLLYKSEIKFAIYESDWYNASESLKQSIWIMMVSLKPVKLFAFKILQISLELCIELSRISYSCYTIMSRMNEEEE